MRCSEDEQSDIIGEQGPRPSEADAGEAVLGVAGSAADGRAQGDSDVERLPAVLRLGAVVAVV